MSGCQFPEWVTDRPAMFGLANGGFLWDKDLKMASTLPGVDAPFDKAQSKFRWLNWFMQYKALDGLFQPWETFTKILILKEFRGVPY